jgi:hypothetical protein
MVGCAFFPNAALRSRKFGKKNKNTTEHFSRLIFTINAEPLAICRIFVGKKEL